MEMPWFHFSFEILLSLDAFLQRHFLPTHHPVTPTTLIPLQIPCMLFLHWLVRIIIHSTEIPLSLPSTTFFSPFLLHLLLTLVIHLGLFLFLAGLDVVGEYFSIILAKHRAVVGDEAEQCAADVSQLLLKGRQARRHLDGTGRGRAHQGSYKLH